jgi:hypothetical protein
MAKRGRSNVEAQQPMVTVEDLFGAITQARNTYEDLLHKVQ